MNHEAEMIQTLDEINFEKMQFRVISKKPKYSMEEIMKVRKDMGNELYQIFNKYRES